MSTVTEAAPEVWDIDRYLTELDDYHDGSLAALLSVKEGRRLLTERDPLLFSIVYMRHHVTGLYTPPGSPPGTEAESTISMSQAHLDFVELARSWADGLGDLQEHRHAFVCPRELGKTSWWFLLIPMWAAAHGHSKFIAAFADTAEQAQLHLSTFRKELDENALLREDFPDLCMPAERAGTGRSVADRQYLYISKSQFVFSARGMDTSVRGLKYGARRPDVLLVDDAEPDESKYSAKLAEERKRTLIDNVFPLNMRARVVITGTTTMYGSIIHQMVRGDDWVKEQNIQVHHYLPILSNAAGRERSLWPQKWSLEWLQKSRQYRWFLKEYMNSPLSEDGIYWTPGIYLAGTLESAYPGVGTTTIMSIDPAVTSKDRSDYSAIAIVRYATGLPEIDLGFEVCLSWAGKVTPDALRDKVESLLASYPETSAAIIEVNQGGELWKLAMRGIPVKLLETTQSVPKNTRAAMALREYETARVLHAPSGPGIRELEQEQCSFPGLYDDRVDAVGTAIIEVVGRSGRKVKPLLAGSIRYAGGQR